jgi:D-serine deaminase-like pyridoxal phosphate-dependent protein
MQSRRVFLAGAMGAPAALRGAGKLTTKDELPTPALMLDLDIFESNVSKMAGFLKSRGRAFRPHAKTHKCPQIARALMRAGAVGACAAKISEAEALSEGGVSGLLVTTAVIGKQKIAQAVRLGKKRPETILCADNAQNVRDLNAAAAAGRMKLNVAVDLFVGRRTGIAPGEPALALAQLISSQPNLKLAGIQAYAGHAAHVVGFEERKRVSHEAMSAAVETRRLFEKSGIDCPLLTGGSTGTYNIDSSIDGVTEIQPGSFIFMDIDYYRIGGQDGPAYQDFAYALTVLSTVVSKPNDEMAIVDAGFKAFSTDRQFGPELKGVEGIAYGFAGDEHGRLNLAKAPRSINVGDRLEFLVPHCDPTVNLYDRIYCLRRGNVEAVWPITARGKSQ